MIKTILFRSNRHLITCSVILLIVCPVKISAQEYAIGADLSFLKSAEDMGFKFLLDYHYSDTWADPGKQFIPEAWKKMTHDQLVKAVNEYTRETMKSFKEAGVLPDMVQVGNEVINEIFLR